MTTAWALVAVSSDAQSDTLADQRAWAQATAAAKGWRLDRVLGEDREGVGSGKAGPRPIVRRLIAELRALPKESRPAWLLVIRSDRFARGKIQDTLFVQDEIINDLGVRIWTRNDGEIMLDTPEAEFMASFKGYYARKDNADRRDKAVAKYVQKRAAGLPVGNRRPYGLTNGPGGRDVVVEEQAEAVRMAFRMRAEGHGFKAIADQMIAVAPPQQFRRSRKGDRPIAWSPQAARRLLNTRAYIATIVDEFTFRRAEQIGETMAHRFASRERKHPWPLAGAMRCVCGYGLVGISSGGKSTRGKPPFRYYCCRKTVNHRGHFVRHRAEPLEAQFLALITDLGEDPGLVAEYRRANLIPTSPALLRRTLKTARAELAAIDARRRRVWNLNETGVVRDEDVQQRLDEIGAERTALMDRIAELEVQIAAADSASASLADAVEELRLAAQTFAETDDAGQRRIARVVGASIGGFYVGEDHALRVTRTVQQAK